MLTHVFLHNVSIASKYQSLVIKDHNPMSVWGSVRQCCNTSVLECTQFTAVTDDGCMEQLLDTRHISNE